MMDATLRIPTRPIEVPRGRPKPGTGTSAPLLSGRLADLALLAWLGGVLLFGRTYSQLGIAPIYLADVLAITGMLLSLPRWGPCILQKKVRGLFLIALAIFILVLQSVYRGVDAGHPAAMKSGCMAIYPLVAVAIAGLVSRDPELIQRFTRRVLPYVPMGFLAIAVIGQFFVAAAAALYLAYAASWSITLRGSRDFGGTFS